MKKILAVLLSVIMCASSLCGCFKDDTNATEADDALNKNAERKPLDLDVVYEDIFNPVEHNTVERTGRVTNVLVLGLDVEAGATDTILLCQVNSLDDSVSILSIPRDTRVKINGNNVKMGNVYGLRGISQLIGSIEGMTGLDIDHYFMMNIAAFSSIIDELDGVYYDVPRDMYYTDPLQNLYIDLEAGYQLLDGDTAEQLIRFRQYPQGDLERVNVQLDLIKALVSQKLKARYISEIADVYSIIEYDSSTDMTLAQMLEIGDELLEINEEQFESFVLPGEISYVGSVAYYIHDQDGLEDIINNEFSN